MGTMQRVGKCATKITQLSDFIKVRYHNTDVVTVTASEIILNTGGYRSYTTKSRMNQTSNQFGLGFQVWQKKGDWFVTFQGKDYEFNDKQIILARNPETFIRFDRLPLPVNVKPPTSLAQ